MATPEPHDPFVGELYADRFKVRDLLTRAREGRLRVPHFQRPLRWRRVHELELLDSIYHRYPIGTLLLWSRHAPAGVVTFGSVTIDAEERADALWIVDGQQRLNTLVGALLHHRAVAPDRTRGTEIAFDLVDRRFVTCRGYVPPTIVPVHRLADPVDTSEWARERDVSPELHRLAQQVGTALVNYEVPTYTTHAQDDRILRKVFTRANTTGVAMRPDEVFKALNTPLTGDATVLTPLEEVASRANFGRIDEATLMKALIAVSGKSPRSGRPDLDAIDAINIHVMPTAEALARAIDLLRDEAAVPHAKLLPGDLPLVVVTHFLHRFPSPQERTVELLVRWIWRAAVSDGLSMTNEHLHRAFNVVEEGGDEHAVVQTLLRQVPREPPARWPSSQVYNPRGHTTRIELCALASLHPLVLGGDGAWVGLEAVDLVDGNEALHILRLRTSDVHLDKTTATRLLAPPAIAAHLPSAPDEVLRSHAFDPSDRSGLGDAVSEEVILRRKERMYSHVEAFLSDLTRWNEDGDVPAFEVAFADDPEAA